MPGMHWQAGGGWDLMLHWNLVAGFDAQTTSRGDHQWTSMNWVMGMAQRDLLGGQITGRVMLSAEPFTTGGKRGYPLLLQTGEEVGGEALHDRQHPHDLFMEVAAAYALPLSDWLAAQVYVAASGEPALGLLQRPAVPRRRNAVSALVAGREPRLERPQLNAPRDVGHHNGHQLLFASGSPATRKPWIVTGPPGPKLDTERPRDAFLGATDRLRLD